MHILAYSDIFKHEQKCLQVHSEHSVTLEYLEPWYIQYIGIFRALEYSEPFYIQNPGIFRALVYLEPWYIQKTGIFRTL